MIIISCVVVNILIITLLHEYNTYLHSYIFKRRVRCRRRACVRSFLTTSVDSLTTATSATTELNGQLESTVAFCLTSICRRQYPPHLSFKVYIIINSLKINLINFVNYINVFSLTVNCCTQSGNIQVFRYTVNQAV